jgi:DNA (cytosine-5)-methyltransferase 1
MQTLSDHHRRHTACQFQTPAAVVYVSNVHKPLPRISAIDLFCGAGGLSLGLQDSGIEVKAGFDLDPACAYPYEENLNARFYERDVSTLEGADLLPLWEPDAFRLLAGCAPCQPFSSHRRGADTREENSWDLLSHFARLVRETNPHFVTMENVPRLQRMSVFTDFVTGLESQGYHVIFGTLYGPDFSLPQQRRRLVLLASRLGPIGLPSGFVQPGNYKTVRDVLQDLPPLSSGQSDPDDALHLARDLSPKNVKRIQASKPGGTWRDWPEDLLAPCHRKKTGESFQAFYGRMVWDEPSPTITTQAYNYGTGRFGHPDQDRSITLREAALLQGFPRHYKFVQGGERPSMVTIGRLIGNAVPPAFGSAVGKEILSHAELSLVRV